MKKLISLAIVVASVSAIAQQHGVKPAEAMKNLSFLTGHWVGKQNFNAPGGSMVGDAKNDIDFAVGGRYIAEQLSTTLPGRKPSDTRHFLTYDEKSQMYKAYWFTDTTQGGPMELDGTLDGTKLTMLNKPAPGRPELRFTYNVTGNTFVYTFEMKQEEKWQLLFTTTYTKS